MDLRSQFRELTGGPCRNEGRNIASRLFHGSRHCRGLEGFPEGTCFFPKEITLAVGDQLTVDNDDEFTHQVYVDRASFKFDSGEQDTGKPVTISFARAGSFDLLCRIHPKMRLRVKVQ